MGWLGRSIAVALTMIGACGGATNISSQGASAANLKLAEEFVHAFYSFDTATLEAALASAEESIPAITYYQGWAQGGHYRIVNRMPCERVDSGLILCSVTVEDDLMKALGIDFDVTDTFSLVFEAGVLVSVETSSNDLPVFHDAREWVRAERPELIREACRGFFAGGPSPGACVRAMVEGYRSFAASEDFPESYRQ